MSFLSERYIIGYLETVVSHEENSFCRRFTWRQRISNNICCEFPQIYLQRINIVYLRDKIQLDNIF